MEQQSPFHRRAHSDTSFRLDDDYLLFDLAAAAVDSDLRDIAADDRFNAKSTPERRYPHRHSNSMDGMSLEFDCAAGGMGIDDRVKNAIGADRLAELALIDPKRAKRILANRQSAARSKERKVRYTTELERKVLLLQTEATSLSAQVTMLQRDSSGLNTENKELRIRLQAMEQEAKLRDALNEALREELNRLKLAAGQASGGNGRLGSQFLRAQPPPSY